MKLMYLANAGALFSRNWANAMTRQGHQVVVVSNDPGIDALRFECPVVRLPIRTSLGYFMNARFVRALAHRIRPDIVHGHYASGYGTLGRLSGSHPYVLSVWGSDVYEFPDRSPWHRHLLGANLRSADWVCSTSHAMASRTRALCPDLRRLSVTPFGVDTSRFAPENGPRRSNVITVGTVKKLEAIYGIDVLMRAFAEARRRVSAVRPEVELRLMIVGGGSQDQPLKRLAHELAIQKHTTFVGPVPNDDVPRYLGVLDVYVALSRCEESFGVAVLEASACSVPVVVSRVGGLPEVVEEGVTGLIVSKEDPSAAAIAIERLLLNADMRHVMGDAGREMVKRRYEWSESVAIMEGVYRDVLCHRERSYRDQLAGRLG